MLGLIPTMTTVIRVNRMIMVNRVIRVVIDIRDVRVNTNDDDGD